MFPITVGKRRFLGAECVWCGWSTWFFGFSLTFEPEFHFGPFLVRVLED